MKSETWKTFNVILLGIGFMLLFTAFLTTSFISQYVTISLKLEAKNTTEFETIYNKKINDTKFMTEYTSEKNLTIIDDYKRMHDNVNLTDRQIVDEKIKTE